MEVTTRREETAFMGANERVASLLLRLAIHEKEDLVVAGYSHQDLAYMLGTYRETVTNALDHLKSEGLIEVGRKRVVLRQVERLRESAQEERTGKHLRSEGVLQRSHRTIQRVSALRRCQQQR